MKKNFAARYVRCDVINLHSTRLSSSAPVETPPFSPPPPPSAACSRLLPLTGPMRCRSSRGLIYPMRLHFARGQTPAGWDRGPLLAPSVCGQSRCGKGQRDLSVASASTRRQWPWRERATAGGNTILPRLLPTRARWQVARPRVRRDASAGAGYDKTKGHHHQRPVRPCLPLRLDSTRDGRLDGSGAMTACSRREWLARWRWRGLHNLTVAFVLGLPFHGLTSGIIPSLPICSHGFLLPQRRSSSSEDETTRGWHPTENSQPVIP